MNEEQTTHLRVCTFKGVQNVPLYVAVRQGYFAARGLTVDVTYTAGSTQQLAGLVRGDYDLIQTAPDNVVHAMTDPVAFGLDATPPRMVLLCGGSVGPLHLYAHPRVESFADLGMAQVGVDNPTSGFALVVRDMLARHGLMWEQDYSVVVAGGTSARLDALRGGGIAAAILYTPYDMLAEEAGFRKLASSTEYFAAYASLATAATAGWVATHSDVATRYLAAVLHALCWIYRPENAAEAQAIMHDEWELGLAMPLAARAYRAFCDPITGFGIDAALDEVQMRQVIALRRTYGRSSRALGEWDDYCDLRWHRRARAAAQIE